MKSPLFSFLDIDIRIGPVIVLDSSGKGMVFMEGLDYFLRRTDNRHRNTLSRRKR